MSDSDMGIPAAEAAKGRANAWTEEAKYQFLLRVVAQYKDEGKTINWNKLSMPGRTTKSLQNMWTKVNAAIDELKANGELGSDTPVKPKVTPRKRAKKIEEDGDDEPETPTKTPAKRGRPPKKPKKEESVKMESGIEHVKNEDSDEE